MEVWKIILFCLLTSMHVNWSSPLVNKPKRLAYSPKAWSKTYEGDRNFDQLASHWGDPLAKTSCLLIAKRCCPTQSLAVLISAYLITN
jgi:hypothetical protein